MTSKFRQTRFVDTLKRLDALLGKPLAHIFPEPQRRMLPDTISAILVIRPGGIGDAVLSAPLIQTLGNRFPAATIDVLAERRNAGVFPLLPEVSRLFRYDNPLELLTILGRKYELIIDTEQWHYLSAIVSRIISSGFSIGFSSNSRSRLFTHSVPYSHEQYEAQSFLNLLTPCGVNFDFAVDRCYLQIPQSVVQDMQSFIGRDLPAEYVTIFPGASIAERRWGEDNFCQLASRLRELGIFPVVVGGKDDKIAGDKIVEQGGHNYAGKTSLSGTAYLLSRSKLLVSGDSGVLHLAMGLSVPTVALFGPSNTVKWAPQGEKHVTVSMHSDCSPCSRFGYTPECTFNVRCIKDISVDEVFTAVTALLNNKKFSATIPNPISGPGGS